MKNIAMAALSMFALASCISNKATETSQMLVKSMPEKQAMSDTKTEENNVLIIFYDSTIIKKEELKRRIEAYNAEVLYIYNNFNGMAIRLANGTTIANAITHFSSIKGVLSVTKDEKMQLMD